MKSPSKIKGRYLEQKQPSPDSVVAFDAAHIITLSNTVGEEDSMIMCVCVCVITHQVRQRKLVIVAFVLNFDSFILLGDFIVLMFQKLIQIVAVLN